MPDLLIHYLTLCNINTNTPSSSSVATWFQLKAESKPCKKSKAPLQPGCWNNCPFISLVSWIHLSPFSLVPPPSFYFFVLFMILDVLWMDPVDFFLPPPPRVALLSKFSNLKLLRPDVALCDTSKTKLGLWMSGEGLIDVIDWSIDWWFLSASDSPCRAHPAALSRRGFGHKHTTLSCCEKAAKCNMTVENKRRRIQSSRRAAWRGKRINKSPFPPALALVPPHVSFCWTALSGCQCCISVQALHNGNHKRNGILLCAIDLFL